jgi:Ala-tRNA(Pro) deacylase
MSADATYSRLIELLELGGARYRLIEHPAEGRTEVVSRLRDNPLAQAAKCIVVRVGLAKKKSRRRYLLAVVPGDKRVDLEKLRSLFGGTDAAFAPRDVAERLGGSVSGSILPFSFNSELHLIVDRSLLTHEELFFNAGRLDRSVALVTEDYLTLAGPRLERIVQEPSGGAVGDLDETA